MITCIKKAWSGARRSTKGGVPIGSKCREKHQGTEGEDIHRSHNRKRAADQNRKTTGLSPIRRGGKGRKGLGGGKG